MMQTLVLVLALVGNIIGDITQGEFVIILMLALILNKQTS